MTEIKNVEKIINRFCSYFYIGRISIGIGTDRKTHSVCQRQEFGSSFRGTTGTTGVMSIPFTLTVKIRKLTDI